jgi:hypothetical protein
MTGEMGGSIVSGRSHPMTIEVRTSENLERPPISPVPQVSRVPPILLGSPMERACYT